MPYGVPRPISVVGLAAGQLLLEDMRVTVLPKQQGRRRPLSRLADRATDFDVELELRVRASEATAAGTPSRTRRSYVCSGGKAGREDVFEQETSQAETIKSMAYMPGCVSLQKRVRRSKRQCI